MTDSQANYAPVTAERIVSPQTLAKLFNTAAEGMLDTGEGQRSGSYVVSYKNKAAIKQHPVRGRITHAKLITTSAAARPLVTHEVHFPSRDKQAGDFEAGKAIFEAHEYDATGNRTGTERKALDQVDMAGLELQPFLEQVSSLKHQ